MKPQKIISFGIRHGDFPRSDHNIVHVIDVRTLFKKNPYHIKALRAKRGTDPEVQEEIRKTPDFEACYQKLRSIVVSSEAETVYLGCTGGHHRSVFLAELLSKELGIPVVHRDIDKK